MATAREDAYQTIRNSILAGEFEPGHQLKELDLVRICRVSRTPVRQAIRALADEGLVSIKANHRTYVSAVDETLFEQNFDVLSMLESYSAGLAAERISKTEIEFLKELNEKMAGLNSDDEKDVSRRYIDLNSEFHRVIHCASGNDRLRDIVLRLVDFPNTIFLRFGKINIQHNPQATAQHNQIIAALEDGDREWAAMQMKMHTESVRRSFKVLWLASKDA